MRVRCIGAKILDFLDDDGKPVKGYQVYFTTPDPDWIGSGVTSPFVPVGTDLYNRIINNLSDYCNNIVDVEYFPNSKGKMKLADIKYVSR